MIGYRDMTFCTYYETCKEGGSCNRALTQQVQDDADKWWGKEGAPICMYIDMPSCHSDKRQED